MQWDNREHENNRLTIFVLLVVLFSSEEYINIFFIARKSRCENPIEPPHKILSSTLLHLREHIRLMDSASGVTSLIPWSWLWRRGIILLLVGVVVFGLFFNETAPPRDPLPIDVRHQATEWEIMVKQNAKNENESTAQTTSTNFQTASISSEPFPCPPCLVERLFPQDEKTTDDLKKESLESLANSDPLHSIEYRRRLADTIANVQRQIARVAGGQAIVDTKWALTLGALVEELDPRRLSQTNSTWDFSARMSQMDPVFSLINRTRHVCPELYMGKRYDHPHYQHGMEMENCSYVPNFGKVLSVVLPAQSWLPNSVSFVISQIKKLYDIPIIALVSNRTTIKFRDKNIRVLVSRKNYSDATLVNGLVKLVKTPYVFLGISLTHFSNQSSLERLVRILDELEHVKVVGGAARDLHGHWIHGCLQQRIANYRATYTMGYYYSKYECMYCDDLLTPFVTTKRLINHIPFTNGLNGSVLYRDWFAKVREAGHLTMLCPDVMFFISNHVNMSHNDWLLMGRQWALQSVQSYTKENFSFTCESVNIKCDNVRSITKSLTLPPCCIAAAHRDIGFLTDFAESQGLQYELQSGSVLGAVKFGSFLPWDMDHDIFVECKDFKKWTRLFSDFAKTYNCTSKVKYKNIFLKILCPYFTLDIFCRSQLSNIYLPEEYQEAPTAIWYGGRWTNVMSNPGLFSRNSMGFEVLKHMQHSAHFTDADKSHGYAKPGTWLPCKIPKHHSCLDRYPADGNLPFLH